MTTPSATPAATPTPAPHLAGSVRRATEAVRRFVHGTIADRSLPQRLTWTVLVACTLPAALGLLGVDFGLSPTERSLESAAQALSRGDSAGAVPAFAGHFVHGILEWAAITVALLTVALAAAQYQASRQSITAVVAVALFWGAAMDVVHVLAADGLISARADYGSVSAFSWAASRCFHVVVLVAGLGTFLLIGEGDRRRNRLVLVATSLLFTLVAVQLITLVVTATELPGAARPEAFVKRPLDLVPLALLLLAWPLVFRRYARRRPGLFAHALVLGLMPETATQLHAAFGAARLHDSHDNIAHFLKLVAYLVPFAGLSMEFVRRQREDARRESEERYRVVSETATDAEERYRVIAETARDAIVSIDEGSKILFANTAAERTFGHPREALLGQSLTVLMAPRLRAAHRAAMQRYLATGQRRLNWDRVQVTGLHASGREIPLEISFGEVQRGGRRTFTGVLRDVTERQRAEEELRESQERYALAVAGANDGLWDWDLRTNQIHFSARWKEMLGETPDGVGNTPEEWVQRVHPQDRKRVEAALAAHLDGSTPQFANEHRMRHRDGTYRWMLARGLAIRDERGAATRMAGSQTDTTERRDAEERLLHGAFHDALTGLPNRAFFMDQLGRAIGRAARSEDYLFGVLFLDLDRFKVVNDSLGHLIGDQLLVGLSRRLEDSLRDGDLVARLGGDEFAVLVDAIASPQDAVDVAERIHLDLEKPFALDGHEVFSGASIGIALSDVGYERPEDVLRDADTAMYRAKVLGKGRHVIFEAGMHAAAVTLMELEGDLRRAVERSEFDIAYQPTVSLETGRITGFEALLRWKHPTRGLVLPSTFIPVAEETGLIVPIGLWLMRAACAQLRAWQQEFPLDPPLAMAVNLSSRQFGSPSLVQQVEDALRESGVQGSSIRLELTESLIMEYDQATSDRLQALKALDVQLQVDDFGTGYSSLSYLRHFPVDTFKIDRSFISRMGIDQESIAIVRTMVLLARNLGLGVVAEGVETAEQLALLRELRCNEAQGYFFARPLETEAVKALLATNPRW